MTEGQSLHLNLDFQYLKNIPVLGVRRAAAFMAIALNGTEDPKGLSLHLPSHSMWQFFPDPVPEELLTNSVAEFRIWVVGCALREVDAAFNDFLDLAWAMNEWSKLHGRKVRSDFKIKSISSKTNVGAKLESLYEEMEEESSDVNKLRSLSNLRNCLTHARGLVTERHSNSPEGLQVLWTGFELNFEQDGVLTPIPTPIPVGGVAAPNSSQPANIVMKVVDRERFFSAGTTISVAPGELHEICQYYLTSTDRAADTLLKVVSARGLQPHDPSQGPSS